MKRVRISTYPGVNGPVHYAYCEAKTPEEGRTCEGYEECKAHKKNTCKWYQWLTGSCEKYEPNINASKKKGK